MTSYRELAGLNQSLLKKILVSPATFLKEKNRTGDSEGEHFVFGSMVDDLLLNPQSFDDKYYVMEEGSISDTFKSITQYVYDYTLTDNGIWSLNDAKLEPIILEAYKVYSYQGRWGDATKLKNFREKCQTYYDSLVSAKGKKIVNKSDYSKAVICVASLKGDPYTGQYHSHDKNTEEWRHKVIQFELLGYRMKGELDKVFIDHVNKTITPIDYKTTGTSVNSFNFDFWKFRYDFQAAFYWMGLSKDPEIKKLVEQGYQLKHFMYIVVEKESINPPMIFRVPNAVTEIGWAGGKLSSGKKLEGIIQAISRYDFHYKNNKWDYPIEYYTNKFVDIEI